MIAHLCSPNLPRLSGLPRSCTASGPPSACPPLVASARAILPAATHVFPLSVDCAPDSPPNTHLWKSPHCPVLRPRRLFAGSPAKAPTTLMAPAGPVSVTFHASHRRRTAPGIIRYHAAIGRWLRWTPLAPGYTHRRCYRTISFLRCQEGFSPEITSGRVHLPLG